MRHHRSDFSRALLLIGALAAAAAAVQLFVFGVPNTSSCASCVGVWAASRVPKPTLRPTLAPTTAAPTASPTWNVRQAAVFFTWERVDGAFLRDDAAAADAMCARAARNVTVCSAAADARALVHPIREPHEHAMISFRGESMLTHEWSDFLAPGTRVHTPESFWSSMWPEDANCANWTSASPHALAWIGRDSLRDRTAACAGAHHVMCLCEYQHPP